MTPYWRYIKLNHERWQLCSSKLQIIYPTKNFLTVSFIDENYLLYVLYKNYYLFFSNCDIFIFDKYDSVMHKLTIALRLWLLLTYLKISLYYVFNM